MGIYLVLAALFVYKAFEEAGSDPLWGVIYLLVGLEYVLEGRPLHHQGGS